jgi:hypothetical protein
MITIEIKDADQITEGRAEIEIYCDTEGIAELERQLVFLRRGETHVHLASPSWAGNELGEIAFGDGNVLIHQATIVKIPR